VGSVGLSEPTAELAKAGEASRNPVTVPTAPPRGLDKLDRRLSAIDGVMLDEPTRDLGYSYVR